MVSLLITLNLGCTSVSCNSKDTTLANNTYVIVPGSWLYTHNASLYAMKSFLIKTPLVLYMHNMH